MLTSFPLLTTFLHNGIQSLQHKWNSVWTIMKLASIYLSIFEIWRKSSLSENFMSSLLLITFFYKWDSSTTTSMEQSCALQGEICWKINIIWSLSMSVSWSICELLSRPSYANPNITFSKEMKFPILRKVDSKLRFSNNLSEANRVVRFHL